MFTEINPILRCENRSCLGSANRNKIDFYNGKRMAKHVLISHDICDKSQYKDLSSSHFTTVHTQEKKNTFEISHGSIMDKMLSLNIYVYMYDFY